MSKNAYRIAALLTDALEAGGIPYAIGGALAYSMWGEPRGTYDVDINLFVEPEELDRVLDALVPVGLQIDKVAARDAAERGDVIVGWCGGLRIDMFTPSIPFSYEAMKTRQRLKGRFGEHAYLSAEATAGVCPSWPSEPLEFT